MPTVPRTSGQPHAGDAMRILVTGASGFIGRHLVPELVGAGHEVSAMTRRPQDYHGLGTAVGADVHNASSLGPALHGCDAAYYLVHSLDSRNFRRRDAAAARAFGAAAAQQRVGHIVYLGGLGDPAHGLSEHLTSRREVEGLLGEAGVRVTTLRAGIVIGDQGTSWEIVRQLVQRLPALVVPTWATTRTQPIAVADVVRYLVGVLYLDEADEADGAQSRTFDIGGAEVLRYTDVLSRLTALENRSSLLLPVPVPSLRLAALAASHLLPLVTGIDGRTVRALIGSMRNEVVVRDDSIRALVPFAPMDYDQAAQAALDQRAQRLQEAAA